MKRYLILIFIITFSKHLFPQQNYEFNYIGTLIINANKPITYSIHFNKFNNKVKGYSVTNIGNENETKSDLSGMYFKNDKSYQLIENSVIETKSKENISNFCFVRMELFEKGKFNKKRLEGNFTGYFNNDTICANGTIILISKNKFEKKLKKIDKKLKKIDKLISFNDVLKNDKKTILKSGDQYSIFCKNKKIKIEISDADLEDGDKIQLKINDIIVLENYTTTTKTKTITYNLKKEETYIQIKSISDGTSPPNTSVVKIIDGENINPVVAKMNKNQIIEIKLIYNKKK